MTITRLFETIFKPVAHITSLFQTEVAIAVTQEVTPHLSTLSKSIKAENQAFEIYREQLNKDFEKWQRDFASNPDEVGEHYLKYLRKLKKKFNSDKEKLLIKKTKQPKIESSVDYINAEKNLNITQSEISRVEKHLSKFELASTNKISQRLQSKSALQPFTLKLINLNFSGPVHTVKIQGNIGYFIEETSNFSPHSFNPNYQFFTAELLSNNSWRALDTIPIPVWEYYYPYGEFSFSIQYHPRMSILFNDARAFLSTNLSPPKNTVANSIQVFDVSDPGHLRSVGGLNSTSLSTSIIDLAPSADPNLLFAATYPQFQNDVMDDSLQLMNIRNNNFSFVNLSQPVQHYAYSRLFTDDSRQYLLGVFDSLQYEYTGRWGGWAYGPAYSELHIYQIFPNITAPQLLNIVDGNQQWFIHDVILSRQSAYFVNDMVVDVWGTLVSQLHEISFDGRILQSVNATDTYQFYFYRNPTLAQTAEQLYVLYPTNDLHIFEKKSLTEIAKYQFLDWWYEFGITSFTVSNADFFITTSYNSNHYLWDVPGYYTWVLLQNYNITHASVNITQYGALTLLTPFNFQVSGTIDPSIIVWTLSSGDIQIKGQPFGQFARNFTQSQINRYQVYGMFYNEPINVTLSVPRRDAVVIPLQLNLIDNDRDPLPPVPEPTPAPTPSPTPQNDTIVINSFSIPSQILVGCATGLAGLFLITCVICGLRRCRCPARAPVVHLQPQADVQMADFKVEQPGEEKKQEFVYVDLSAPRIPFSFDAILDTIEDTLDEEEQDGVNQLPTYDQSLELTDGNQEYTVPPPPFTPGIPTALSLFQPRSIHAGQATQNGRRYSYPR